jgi:hypothetical protein
MAADKIIGGGDVGDGVGRCRPQRRGRRRQQRSPLSPFKVLCKLTCPPAAAPPTHLPARPPAQRLAVNCTAVRIKACPRFGRLNRSLVSGCKLHWAEAPCRTT